VAETRGENARETGDAAAEPPAETPSDASQPAPDNAPATRECPYCHETIRADALACRFCGHDLVAAHPAKVVLSQETWNTDIPQWLLDVEQKAQRRRQIIRQIQSLQWPAVIVLLSAAVLAILWRIVFPPAPASDQVRVLPRYGRANDAPSPAPSPTPRASATPSPASLGGFAASATPTPTPLPAATPEPSASAAAPSFSSAPADTGIVGDSGPAIVTTAQEIAAEFQDMRAIAEDKYNGQDIRVTGTVKRIDTTGNMPFILLGTVGGRPPIKCLLKPSEKAKLARVKPGKVAQVRGICEGAFLEVILADSVIEL
jgi:glutaredoxin